MPVLLLSSSCLVTSTPRLEDPRQTPIILTALSPDPRVPLERHSDGTLDFEVQVRSEDAGNDVELIAILDFGFPASKLRYPFLTGSIPASHIDNLNRSVSFGTNAQGLALGCHSVTLLAAHKFSADGTAVDPFDASYCPKRPDDYARLTWIVNICEDPACGNLPLQGPNGCPMSTDISPCLTPDAGAQ